MQSIRATDPVLNRNLDCCPSCGGATPSPGLVWEEGGRVLCVDDFHIRLQVIEASLADAA